MALNISVAPKQLSDGNTQGTLVNPRLDSAGNGAKLGFFGTAPVVPTAPTGNVATVAAGATTGTFVNTSFSGGIGTTGYTIGDVIAALKSIGLLTL